MKHQVKISTTKSLKNKVSHKRAALWQAAAWSLPTIHTRPFHTISDMLVFHYGHLPRTILLGQLTSLQRAAACRQASGVDDLIYSLPLWNVPIHQFDEFSVTQHHISTARKHHSANSSASFHMWRSIPLYTQTPPLSTQKSNVANVSSCNIQVFFLFLH